MRPSGLRWRSSSHSGGSNNCVEVALLTGAIAVRDSKDRCGGCLVVSAIRWRAFLAGVKSGLLRRAR